MTKIIIHYTNDVDPLIAHMIIGKLLLQFKHEPPPYMKSFLVDYQGYRFEGMQRKTAMTFYVTNLETNNQ